MRAFSRYNFDGIRDITLPLFKAIMETQPIIVGLLFISLLLSHQQGPWDEISVIALFVGLHWWALLISRTLSRRKIAHRIALFLGLVGAIALMLTIYRSLLAPILWQQVYTPWLQGCGNQGCSISPIDIAPFFTQESLLFMMVALIFYSWLRGMRQVNERDDSPEKAMATFKWSFIAFIILLVLAELNRGATQIVLFERMTIALPLFFLSSLITITCTQLLPGYTRGSGKQTSSTRFWTLLLPIFGVIALIVLMLLEVFVFPSLLALFHSLLSGVENVIVAVLNWLASLQPKSVIRHLFHVHHENSPVLPSHPMTGVLQTVGIISCILFVLLTIYLLRRFVGNGSENDAELVREHLSWWTLLRRRRRQNRGDTFKLEPLDPDSARAHYRTFLLTMAKLEQRFARATEETPGEYQTRLLASVQQLTEHEATPVATPLANLTEAYNRERYGEMKTFVSPYDRRQVSRLVKFLKRAVRR